MGRKRTIQEDIHLFLEMWGYEDNVQFMRDIIPIFDLYNVDEESDWVREETGGDQEHVNNVRLIRTVYLMSKIAAHHAGSFCRLNIEFRDLWKRMDKHGVGQDDN